VAIQAALGGEEWPSAVPLRVRCGVHTGEAEFRDGAWYGPSVNRAARLRALADGGQTLVSGVTAGLVADQVPPGVGLLYRGRRVLRGIERPEEVWEVVAADDPRLAAARSTRVGDLPLALTRFVGRGADIQRLVRLVEDERLITLTGPGGSGKTRLALEVAADAQRRGEVVWLAELAPLGDGGLVAEAVGDAVGVEAGPDRLERLLAQPELLAGLLVLDNCEHVLDACATLTGRLLAAAPELRVLATSREPLGLAGERLWPVRPLVVPEASARDPGQLAGVESVQLLLDRARAVRPDLELSDDDAVPVGQICRALDGLPLAIELAAGRLRSLSLADLAGRLGDQLAVLTRHRPAGRDDARHRTLRMTLDWSYDLLTEQQRTLARRLSVFAGGFRLDAVEAVCGGDIDVLDAVDELVAKSLVSFDGTTARYRLLEPIRQYLADRLEDSGATDAVSRAHADWVAGLCHQLGSRLLEDQKSRSSRLREESGNIDLALRWSLEHGEHEIALRIVGSLGQYWFFYDQTSGRRWCERVTETAGPSPRHSRAAALVSAGIIAQNDQEWDQSLVWLREALAIYVTEQAIAGQATSLFWLGLAFANCWDPGHDDENSVQATQCFEEALRLSLQSSDRIGVGWCRVWLSSQAFWRGDLDEAERLANQVLQECDMDHVEHPVGQALCNLGFIARRRGHDAAALGFLQDAVTRYRDLGDRGQLARVLVDLAAQRVAVGQTEDALQALAESSRLDEQLGRLAGRSYRLAVAAVVHLARGHVPLAISALGAYDMDAHTIQGTRRAGGRAAEYSGWFDEAVAAVRARLDPDAVAAAATGARAKHIDQLVEELIVRPADAIGGSRPRHNRYQTG
jgi:predicted ATPase